MSHTCRSAKSDPTLHDGELALACCHAIGHRLHDGYLIKGIWRQVEQERLNGGAALKAAGSSDLESDLILHDELNQCWL